MIPTDYNRNAKKFVRSVINQRQYIIDLNRSYKNKAQMLRIIDKLRTQLSVFPYTSDMAISNFLIRYRAEIFELIPGGNNETRQKKYRALLGIAYNIVNSKAGCSSFTTEGAKRSPGLFYRYEKATK